MKILAYFWVFCVLLFLTSQSFASNLPSIHTALIQAGYTEIPLHKALHQNTLLVDVSFSTAVRRNKPVSLILDTGSATTYINQKIVKQYGFRQTEKYLISGGIDGHHSQTPQIIIPTIHLFNFTSHMLDTGVPFELMLDTAYSKKLNLKSYHSAATEKNNSHSNFKLSSIDIESFSISPLPSESDKTATAADLKSAQIGIPIFGVVGLDWMQKSHAIIDTANDQLYVKT